MGGETWVAGDPEITDVLAYAMQVEDVERDQLTHGFHSYPARMHWATAERVLSAFGPDATRVLDPFVGSGTVLIEARVAGCPATGVDLNPLATRLARVKCDPLDRARRAQLATLSREVAARSEERVRARVPVHAQLPDGEVSWYAPHVLKEMAGLFEEIGTVEDDSLRERLLLVFSALVVKFSKQRSDTAEEEVDRRLRKGLVTEFFVRKTSELCERLEALEAAVTGPYPQILNGDARRLQDRLDARFDLVLTSPPYGGTYDYASHHARRFAWLGIDGSQFGAREIGARRHGDARERFYSEMHAALTSIREVTLPGALCIFLMGDAQYGSERVPADELMEALADEVGFEPLGLASQERVDFAGGAPRREHLMALERV
jgi:DNA modification methylase